MTDSESSLCGFTQPAFCAEPSLVVGQIPHDRVVFPTFLKHQPSVFTPVLMLIAMLASNLEIKECFFSGCVFQI